MKIEQNSLQLIKNNQNKKEKTTEVKTTTFEQKLMDAQKAIKQSIQEHFTEIQEAQTSLGENNPRVQQLIAKFKNGKKLTAEEMGYLRKHAPGIVPYIERIARERKVIEICMKIARSKTEVQMVVYRTAKLIDQCPYPEEREIRAKQLQDAKQEYEKTEEYKEKPNSPLENEEKPKKVRYNQKQSHKIVKTVYEQIKIPETKSTFEYEL